MGRDSFGFLRAMASLSRRAVAVTGVVLLIGTLASTARAAGGWSIVQSENLRGPNGQLSSVSCSAASACTAVGTFVKRSGRGVSLAERWDGKRWSVQPTPSPSGAPVSILYGVSCASPSACIAVGRSLNSSGTGVTLAERWNGANWSIVRTPNPPGAEGSFLDGVVCTSPSACIAVGAATDRAGFPAGTLAERWNGTSWSILPTPAANGGGLNSVACTSSAACTAVGFYKNTSGVLVTLAERWNGTNWGIFPTPNPTGAQPSFLNGVACTSAAACTAVGNYNTSSGAGMTLAERWNGTKWSIQPTPNTAGAPGSVLNGVSCPSASVCTAVGAATDSSGNPTATLAERWNGTTWSIEPTPQPLGARVSVFYGVACASTSVCVAVGNADPRSLAERWNGTRWSVEPTHDPLGAHAGVLNGVACRSASTCTAVGVKAGPLNTPLGTLAERWNGTNWSIQPTPNPAGTAGSSLTAVTCPSAPACVAVGFASDRFGNPTATLAERWNGTHWSIQPTPNPAGTPGSLLSAVTCLSASDCVAVGFATNSSGNPTRTLAERWNGTRWSIQPTPNPVGAASSLLSGVACTSSSACIAVGVSTSPSGKATALAERWNGTNWSIQPTPTPAGAPGSALNAVACPSASVCIAVGNAADSSGNATATLAERWNGTNWSILPTPNPTGAQGGFLSSVACPSVSVCTAVGLVFSPFNVPSTLAERWNGTTWTIQSTPRLPGVYDIDPPAVACPSLSNCTAVGGYKNNGLKLTLAERWSPATQDNPPAAPTGADHGSLGAGCARPSLPMPPRREEFGQATVAPPTLATRPWCRPNESQLR